ncbi:MAG: alanine racemase [Oscillospiraceae bacterium]|nr:alanine racemase [Oscillospiraceae bacterium]
MTRVEINLSALVYNLKRIRSLSSDKELIAVVKANAYGHGSGIISDCLYKHGVRCFAVSSFYEAEQIREVVGESDILILGATSESFINEVAENDYIQAIVSVEHARKICEHLKKNAVANRRIRCHIKVDTGMTRFGVSALGELTEIMEMPLLKPEALFTHFSSADAFDSESRAFTINQQSKFVKFASMYKLKYHSQNSAGVLYHKDFSGDMVRAGIALYGYRPNTAIKSPVKLKPVLTLKSEVVQIREVGAGTAVSYGRSYITDSSRRLAVVPVGYADGYSRNHSNKGKVLINGNLASVRGKVCMDYIIVDITDTDNVKVGDEVIVYGGADSEISVEHIADSLGTIPYEVTCAVSERVPRVAVD